MHRASGTGGRHIQCAKQPARLCRRRFCQGCPASLSHSTTHGAAAAALPGQLPQHAANPSSCAITLQCVLLPHQCHGAALSLTASVHGCTLMLSIHMDDMLQQQQQQQLFERVSSVLCTRWLCDSAPSCPRLQGLTAGKVADAAPMEPVTESGVRAAETREGSLVLLPDAIPCNVSFSRGDEKSVLLGVHGLPQVGCLHGGACRRLAGACMCPACTVQNADL